MIKTRTCLDIEAIILFLVGCFILLSAATKKRGGGGECRVEDGRCCCGCGCLIDVCIFFSFEQRVNRWFFVVVVVQRPSLLRRKTKKMLQVTSFLSTPVIATHVAARSWGSIADGAIGCVPIVVGSCCVRSSVGVVGLHLGLISLLVVLCHRSI